MQETKQKAFFDTMPLELKIEIFSHLNLSDLTTIRKVCKEWLQLTNDDFLWKINAHGINFLKDADKDLLKAVINKKLDFLTAVKTQQILLAKNIKSNMKESFLRSCHNSGIEEQSLCTIEQLIEANLINTQQAKEMGDYKVLPHFPAGLAKALALKLLTWEQILKIGSFSHLYLLTCEKGLKALEQQTLTVDNAVVMPIQDLINHICYSSGPSSSINADNYEAADQQRCCSVM